MNLYLGNLDLRDIVIDEYLETIQKFLETNGFQRENVCDDIGNKAGNYHIFDMPRTMQICGLDKASQFIEFIQTNNLGGAFKEMITVKSV